MSTSGRQRLSLSDLRRERKELLLGVERAHRSDIHTYSSGHLGPTSLFPKPLPLRSSKPIWEGSKRMPNTSQPSHLQEKRDMEEMEEARVGEMIDAWYSFTMATTLQEAQTQQTPTGTAGVGQPAEAVGLEQRVTAGPASAEMEQAAYWCRSSPCSTASRREELRLRRLFDRQVLRTKDLAARKASSGEEGAWRHERRLQQELNRVAAQRDPTSQRLHVYRRIFDDVCGSTPAFASALREIKAEYDLYLDSLLSNQAPLQDMSAFVPLEACRETTKLAEATQQVWSLEDTARRALQENDRVRAKYEDAQAKAKEDQEGERRSESPHHGQSTFTVVEDLDGNQDEASSVTQLQSKRRQVWRVWKKVQELQKMIRETMVPTVTTSALEGCIRDTKADIKRLIASNECLRSASEDLEQNILMVLNRAKVTEETKAKVLQKIWSVLNGDD